MPVLPARTVVLRTQCQAIGAHHQHRAVVLYQDIQQRLPKDALASTGKQIDARAIRVCL